VLEAQQTSSEGRSAKYTPAGGRRRIFFLQGMGCQQGPGARPTGVGASVRKVLRLNRHTGADAILGRAARIPLAPRVRRHMLKQSRKGFLHGGTVTRLFACILFLSLAAAVPTAAPAAANPAQHTSRTNPSKSRKAYLKHQKKQQKKWKKAQKKAQKRMKKSHKMRH
jgi:hypothetical protein